MTISHLSRFKLASLIAASLSTTAAVAITISTLAYRGELPYAPIFWIIALLSSTLWLLYAIACARDTILATVLARLEQVEATLLEYGDQREAAGEKAAAKYIHHTHPGRRLVPVGTDDN